MAPINHRQPTLAPPAILQHWQAWAIAMVFLLVPFFVKIPRVLNNHPVAALLGDQLHVILLGSITLMLYWYGPLAGRIWWAALAAAFTGGAIEFLQSYVGRTALWHDFFLDLLGIAIATAFVLWRGDRHSWARVAFIALILFFPAQLYRVPFISIAAYRTHDTFPVIANFEGRYDGLLWAGSTEKEVGVEAIEDGPDGPTRVLRISGEPPNHWPATYMRRFPRDWSDYGTISLDVRLVGESSTEVKLGVRLDDFSGLKKQENVYQTFVVTPEWQTVTFMFEGLPVRNSERVFEHNDVDRIILYIPRPKAPTTLEIDNILLGPAPGEKGKGH
jgi:hypothetical protein